MGAPDAPSISKTYPSAALFRKADGPRIVVRPQPMDRERYPSRVIRPGQEAPNDDLRGKTPEERLEMMWPLVVDTWAFMGKPLDESRLPRHVVRVVRGGC